MYKSSKIVMHILATCGDLLASTDSPYTGGYADDTTNIFCWSVRQEDRKYFPIQTYLEHEEAWVSLIAEMISRFREVEED